MLHISNNNFIRTTDKYHEEEVRVLLNILFKKKLIYKGFYESYYCIGCEQYLTDSDLIDGKCPLHNREPELKKEEAYMFKLSSFQDKLFKLIKSGEYEILPEVRRKEILTFIQGGLKDISISRLKEKISWGIELPFDKNHVAWVWPDALWNYVSGLRYNSKINFNKFWPANVQLMAKDILRVHATIWPALLLGAGYKLPKTLFIHGYFTIGGQKMSKSLGNVISPIYLTNQYGVDSVRYYLMRTIPFGSDSDVSEQGLIVRHNSELADKFGNLVSRVSALVEKYGLEKTKNNLLKKLKLKEIEKYFENYEIDRALSEVFAFIEICNEYVQSKKPWETHDKKVLYELIDSIKAIAILLWPFIPSTSEKIAKEFGFEVKFDNIEKSLEYKGIKKVEALFKKIEVKEIESKEEVGNRPEHKEAKQFDFKNYKSYLMGASGITDEELIKLGINIQKKDEKRLLLIPNNKIEDYLKLIEKKLDKGFWNEVVGNKVIFIFKAKDGKVGRFELNNENQEEIAKLCAEFNNQTYEQTQDILGYLLDNDFYADYVNKIKQKNQQKINKEKKISENKIEGVMNMSDMVKYDDVQNAHKKSILEQPKNSTQSIVNFLDFAKLDLRVGTIKKVEDVENADKLLKLSVDTGDKERTILAGIKMYYKKDELIGKQIIVICNLEPRVMRGITSEGMLLAAASEDHSKVILLGPEKKAGEGWKVS
jgi:methionyl-tRNA synthetase